MVSRCGTSSACGHAAVALATSLAVGCASESVEPYLERRASFATRLIDAGPAPGFDLPAIYPDEWERPEGDVEQVRYPSAELDLKAWVFVPEAARRTPAPALVYLHPGVCCASESTLTDPRPFLEAGFVVMVPTFRGAGDNPGHFEFLLGEVDDAAAASRWLAAQPYVDGSRVFAFGWSAGGVIASLLSLMDDVPLRHTGSAGGLSNPDLFAMVESNGHLPFDRAVSGEVEMRMLIGNVRWMQRPHYAYVGSDDSRLTTSIALLQPELASGDALLEVIMVPGDDHRSSGAIGLEAYFDLVSDELRGGGARPGP